MEYFLPRLYVLTDEQVLPNHELLDKSRIILEAGVRMLQVRFKQTPPDERIRLGKKLRELTGKHDAILIINDFPELAKEIEADGVHLGADDARVDQARRILGPDAVIGVSCYASQHCVKRWKPSEVSYIGLASPYPSPTKVKKVPDMKEVKRLVSLTELPVYLIGGITIDNALEILDTGCHGIAVISAILNSRDPAEQVSRFLTLLDHHSTHLSET